MAKRKRIKSRTKRISLKLGDSKRKKQRKIDPRLSFMGILKVLAVVCALAVVGIGLFYLDKYVKKATLVPQGSATLELEDVPVWVNEQLKEKIYAAAGAYGEDLRPDEDAARSVQQNIETLVAWLDGVTVKTTHDRLVVNARWRKPLALVESGSHRFYVDAKLVVLDFVPIPNLPIVTIKGLSTATEVPSPGEVWQCDDLDAAVTILAKLDQMDKSVTPDKPLLYEIDSADVSNFNGRQNSRKPHIVLYAKDDTRIIWGAEFGTWQRYLEAPDEEKLSNLYNYYKEHGTILNKAKYIDLRSQQYNVSLPVDKY